MLPPATIGPGEFFPVVGVGPHPEPFPSDAHFDPELLANGDRRNVLDKYRYWSVEAIVADLNTKRHGLQIAIENWQHDLNIGSIVLTVVHHPTVEDLALWAKENSLPLIGIDNVPGSLRLEGAQLPEKCVLLFGQEGAGMSEEGIAACSVMYAIDQYGSTRSMNASAAGAIAMYHWALQHLPR